MLQRNSKTDSAMPRAIKIHQLAPKEAQTRLAIVPYGRYLNTQLQRATAGQIIDFIVDWRKDRFILLRRAKVAVNTSCFTLLLKSIYGEDATWQSVSEQWRANCIVDGLGKSAFDEQSVLLLEVKKYIKEEYEAEQERIRLAVEREERMKAIKGLRLQHKDVIY